MFADEGLPEELTAFEARLASLRPVVSRINRDQLMYRLGVQSALGRLAADGAGSVAPASPVWWQRPRLWQAAALVLACTTLTLGSFLVASPRYVDRVVYLPRSVTTPPNALPAPPDRVGDPQVEEPPFHLIVAGNRSRLKPNERWLTALAAPGSRYSQNAELRARVPRIASDPGAPILVIEQRHPDTADSRIADQADAPLLRGSDHRQMIELLNPASH